MLIVDEMRALVLYQVAPNPLCGAAAVPVPVLGPALTTPILGQRPEAGEARRVEKAKSTSVRISSKEATTGLYETRNTEEKDVSTLSSVQSQ